MLRTLVKHARLGAWWRYREMEAAEPRLTYLFWESTLACNLACTHCGSDCIRATDTSQELTAIAAFDAASRAAEEPGDIIVAITGGEPLLRPDLFTVAPSHRTIPPTSRTDAKRAGASEKRASAPNRHIPP